MLSNYGFEDGTGTYYIQIDTDACIDCETRDCVEACPDKLFEIIEDDWEDEVASIREEMRNQIKTACASCKSTEMAGAIPPCSASCSYGAIKHTW